MSGKARVKSVKRFYFIEYFHILLESVLLNSKTEAVFESFKELKQQNQLGESRFKKLEPTPGDLTDSQINHYKYTFNEVIDESVLYNLIKKKKASLELTEEGKKLLQIYKHKGMEGFGAFLLQLMESKLNHGFRYIINKCYEANPEKSGLLVFPIYSPLKLGLAKSDIRTVNDIHRYCFLLKEKLENDLKKLSSLQHNLEKANEILIQRLTKAEFIAGKGDSLIDSTKYNIIIKRIRDYWLNYFLKTIYNVEYSISYFEIWIYRGKQLGIMNTHELYPGFNGKLMYPISLVKKNISNRDFKKIFDYPDGESLYLHQPRWTLETQEEFVKNLYESYQDLKRLSRTYFISLADLRDVVCYKMKISDLTFNDFIKKAYKLNLENKLKLKISLEIDRPSKETKVYYLKREPVLIDNKPKNIIGIDLKK